MRRAGYDLTKLSEIFQKHFDLSFVIDRCGGSLSFTFLSFGFGMVLMLCVVSIIIIVIAMIVIIVVIVVVVVVVIIIGKSITGRILASFKIGR